MTKASSARPAKRLGVINCKKLERVTFLEEKKFFFQGQFCLIYYIKFEATLAIFGLCVAQINEIAKLCIVTFD